MSIRIALVDDHPVLLEGLTSLYHGKANLEVVATGHSAIDAVRIAEGHRPDVIVMDLTMPGDCPEAIRLILAAYPLTKVVVFTASNSIGPATELLEAGISRYVLKVASAADLQMAIVNAHAGQTYITPAFATKVIVTMKTAQLRQTTPPSRRLHHREEQIIRGVLEGDSNKEIGRRLNISEKTVNHYMTSLMNKLNVRNRLELVWAVGKISPFSPQTTRKAGRVTLAQFRRMRHRAATTLQRAR
jgi:two-component system, NarL family, nitrate/nitrite response regulator NarL